MAFVEIDPTTPAGTDKKKFGDDRIREFKEQTIANLKVLSNYPADTMPALRTAVWTTATRPAGDELIDRVTGYNTDLGCDEYYDSVSTSWKTKGLPAWTVATRPTSPAVGMFGFCSDLAVMERWNGSAWIRVSGGRRGDIKIWSGASTDIEAGWVLADGSARTHPEGGSYTPPNLRDRFIVGAGTSYGVGATGGEAQHVLTWNEMPSHTHAPQFAISTGSGLNGVPRAASQSAGNGMGITVGYAGGDAAHENRPPYYALCYLYKL